MLTSYPELADIILMIDTTYPYAGQYAYSSGTIADVWNTIVTLSAIDMTSDRGLQLTFSHIAGETVSVSGGVKIYMRIPDLTDETYAADAQAFVATLISWFPDVQ